MDIKFVAEKSLMTDGHYFGQDIDEGNFKVINISKGKKSLHIDVIVEIDLKEPEKD